MKKILASDYDGTLYIDKTIIYENITKIKEFRSKGNLFVIATGRSYTDFKDEIRKFKIPYDYLILNHGSVILDKDKKVFKYYAINKNIILDIDNFFSLYKNEIKDKNIYGIKKNNVSAKYLYITKMAIELYNYEDAKMIAKALNSKFGAYINAYAIKGMRHILVEIVASGVDKSLAINKIATKEKIDIKNIYTIGNGSNDLKMLQDYNGAGIFNSEEEIINNISKIYNNVYELIIDIESIE